MMMQRAVKFACGHDQVVILVSSSVPACEETVAVLRRSSCPDCHRKDRYEAAHACTQRAGLLPLRAASPQQLALAEIVRGSLWELLCPYVTDHPCYQLLVTLFNRQTLASFWLALRGWPLYRLNSELVEYLLLNLLQPQSRNWGEGGGTSMILEGWPS